MRLTALVALIGIIIFSPAWAETYCVRGDPNGNISVIDDVVVAGTVVKIKGANACPKGTVPMTLEAKSHKNPDDLQRRTPNRRGSSGIIIGDHNTMVIVD